MSNYVNYSGNGLLLHLVRSKGSISVIFFVYCISIFAQFILSLTTGTTYAATTSETNRLIAVLVDTSVYNQQQTQIDRYAGTYLQAQYSNSKALIIPINTENLQAQDIYKILQNLYFDGQKDVSSMLIGTVLIGNIPLPVINDKGYYYPSIYPYIDFIDPQFVYSDTQNIFISNPKGVTQNPELWHSLIRFNDQQSYTNYFKKLATYAAKPDWRVSDKIWVDDLVQEQQSYDQKSVRNYINNFLFADDLSRQRYTNVLADLLNGQTADQVYDIFRDASQIMMSKPTNQNGDIPSDLAQEQQNTATSLASYFSWIATLAKLLGSKKETGVTNTFDTEKTSGLGSSKGVPTMFLQSIIEGYLKSYHQLYSDQYHSSVNNLVEPSGRYYNSGDRVGIDSHIWKTFQHDEITKTLITNFNNQLEKTADDYIESEKLYMNVPLPTRILHYGNGDSKNLDQMTLNAVYDANIFGSDPLSAQNIQDMMIHRGTYLNLTGVSSLTNVLSNRLPYVSWDDSNPVSKSIGATYGFQSREVEASRGHNPFLIKQDQQLAQNLKAIFEDAPFCENNRNGSIADDGDTNPNGWYVLHHWGGYTPLNIDVKAIEKNGALSLDSRLIDFTWSIGSFALGFNPGTFYDIAGSKLLTPSRKLTVVQGDVSTVSYKTSSSDWSMPDWCDSVLYDEQGVSKMTPDEVKVNYPDCVPPLVTAQMVYEKTPRNTISLSGISDNYQGYKSFTVPQKTAVSLGNQKYTNARMVNLIKGSAVQGIKGQSALDYGTTEAAKQGFVYPVAYCSLYKIRDTLNYTSEADFFNVFTRWSDTSKLEKGVAYRMYINDHTIRGGLWSMEAGVKNDPPSALYSLFWGNGGDYRYLQESYYKTLSSRYVHKSPTSDELYGKQLDTLKSVSYPYPYPDPSKGTVKYEQLKEKYQFDGLKFSVDSVPFVLPGNAYTINGNTVTFATDASITLYGKTIFLQGLQGTLNNGTITLKPINPLGTLPRYGGMNVTTADRPIDSVRYTNFQGIGGDLVTLVYPNLYNVEVFTKNGYLKNEDQIKQSIKEYLVVQAKKYRTLLQEQQEKSQQFYQSNAKAFDLLSKADPYASPVNRGGYDLSKITDDFFIKGLAMRVGGTQFTADDMLTVLARNLYYQNLIVPQRSGSESIVTDIDNTYRNALADNLNQKRKFVFNTYLTTDSDKTGGQARLKDWSLLSGVMIPAYEKGGYELTSITSNGSDYHVDSTLNPLLKQFQITSDMMNAQPRVESYQDNAAPLVCGSSVYDQGGVSILQYPKAFQCWLEDVKRTSIKLTVNGDLVGLIKNISNSGFDGIVGYGKQQLTPYQNFWGELVTTQQKLTQSYQKWVGLLQLDAPQEQLQDLTKTNPSGYQQLGDILSYLSITTSSRQMSLGSTGSLIVGYDNPTNTPFTLSVSATGSACMFIGSTNLCNQSFVINNSSFGKQTELSYGLKVLPTGKLGDTGLLFKVCSSSNSCTTYVQSITIVPGKLASVKVIDMLNGGHLARGSEMPLLIQGFDSGGNPLHLASDPYRITTKDGLFTSLGQISTGVDINTRSDVELIYRSLTGGQNRITIDPQYPDSTLPTFNHTVSVVDPTLNIADRAGSVSLTNGITISLPSKPDTLVTRIASGEISLVPNAIPMIRLSFAQVNGKDVLGMVRVSSQNGLFNPGVIGSQSITGDTGSPVTQYVWSDQDSFIVTGSSQSIYLYPSYRAGNDVLQITLGEKVWSIPVSVLPGNPAGVTINAPDRLIAEQTGSVDLFVTDYWGNQLKTSSQIDLGTHGYMFGVVGSSTTSEKNSDGWITSVQTVNGTTRLSVLSKTTIGKGYLTAQLRGVALDQQRASYAGLTIQSVLWPQKGINSLVLQLKGSDWGNIMGYQTQQNIFAPSLIDKSDKLLSVVTTLVDHSNLKKTVFTVHPHGGLGGEWASGSVLGINQGKWTISTNGSLLALDTVSEYQMTQGNDVSFGTTPSNSLLTYVPQRVDSVITSNVMNNGSITINGVLVFAPQQGFIHPDILIRYDKNTAYGAGLYRVLYRGSFVGTMMLYRKKEKKLYDSIPTIQSSLSQLYLALTGYTAGTTNTTLGVQIIVKDSSYELPTQNTQDTKGLIAQFGQGRTVGDSSKYQDQFGIVIGDAGLSKATRNVPAYALVADANNKPVTKDIDYDTGIGQLIYRDSTKSIDQVISIDFNNDKLKDLAIVYSDGSLRLLKNYGGKQPWRDMGNLMVIADGIKKIHVGDVDKDGYQDIIVATQEGKMRVYYNNNGQFDVDGYPVCLDVAGGPEDLSQLYYWTVRDMDLDGGIDIVTYDTYGDVKVFYGGRSGSSDGSSYVSRTREGCDEQWKTRQSSTLVQSFGLNILSNPIKDNSLLHRSTHQNGLNLYTELKPSKSQSAYNSYESLEQLEAETSPTLTNKAQIEGAGIIKQEFKIGSFSSVSDFANKVSDMAVDSVNITQSVNAAYADVNRYVPVSDSLRPTYTSPSEESLYIPSAKINSSDPFQSQKILTDLNGGVLVDRDLVEVKVKITGTPGVKFSYLEQLLGPWVVPVTDEGIIDGIKGDLIRLSDYVNYRADQYLFALNGATMDNDGVIEFSYIVQYRAEKLVNIEVLPSLTYPTIQAYSLDGCQKTQWNYDPSSGQTRTYSSKVINYNGSIIKQQTDSYAAYDKGAKSQLKDVISSAAEDMGIFNYIKERRNSSDVVARSQGVKDWSYLTSLPTRIEVGFAAQSRGQEIAKEITNITSGLCNGFKPGEQSCAGNSVPLGVPFNMAIPPLTPGMVRVMGYNVYEDKGLPIFAFPAANLFPVWPFSPNQVGGRLDPSGNTSQIRIYATPTLTTALGFALCFGPYASVGIKLPSPFKNVMGNCLVFATNPLAKGQQQCNVQSDPNYTPQPEISSIPGCVGSLTSNPGQSSAIQMVMAGNDAQGWISQQRQLSPSKVYDGTSVGTVYESSHQGVQPAISSYNSVIQLNNPAKTRRSAEVFSIGPNANNTTIVESIGEGLKQLKSKAREHNVSPLRELGDMALQGIGMCIAKVFNNQVSYITANMLTSSLTVVLPDLSQLGTSDQWSSMYQNFKETTSNTGTGISTGSTSGIAKVSSMLTSQLMSTGVTHDLVHNINRAEINPFYQVEQLLNEVPLFSVSRRDVIIKIPYANSSDLLAYKSFVSAYLERNRAIIQQWKDYESQLRSQCSTTGSKDCTELLNQVIVVNTQIGQTTRSIQQNMLMIDQYIRFKELVLPQRKEQQVMYLKELITSVSSITSQLSIWSVQNASRFTAWASAIRSMVVAVKTWQLLIDFSMNLKRKCGTCRYDAYDGAGCSLGGLCPNFPLFAWPKFRVPDVIIDFSHFDAGIDLVLPSVRFMPITLPLERMIQIPDLPVPPDLAGGGVYARLDLKLPTIPILPAPPELPALPSFAMNVQMKLPTLPPAPKIPMLPEVLSSALQVADFLGDIMCMMKGNIGLVGEKFVKQKIEQITARTWEIRTFDSILAVVREPRPTGYDLRADVYVSLRFYFDQLYSVFDALGDTVNHNTTMLESDLVKSVSQVNTFVQQIDPVTLSEKANVPLRYDVTIDPLSYNEFDARIIPQLKQFVDRVDDVQHKGRAQSILTMAQQPIITTPNLKGLDQAQSQTESIVTTELDKATQEYYQIKNNYDSWLRTLTQEQYVSDETTTLTIGSSLYTINDEARSLISDVDIAREYVKGSDTMLHNYQQALSRNTADSLGMDPVTYQKTVTYVDQMKSQTSKVLAYEGKIDQSTTTSPSEIVSTVDQGGNSTSQSTTATTNSTTTKELVKVGFDQTNQRDGYLVTTAVELPGGGVVYADVDVIKPETLGTTYRSTSFRENMNGADGEDADIVLWDNHEVYVKYAGQKDIHGSHVTDRTVYRLPVINSVSQLDSLMTTSNGYLAFDQGILYRSQWFKIWSSTNVLHNFGINGQTYDTLMFHWLNPEVIGQSKNERYVMRFTDLVDRHIDAMGPDSKTKFVLVVPSGVTVDPNSMRITLPGYTNRTIKDLMDRGVIHDVINYDPSQDMITGILRNLQRKWYYTQVARMELVNGVYRMTSPWSNQDVGGYQISADQVSPSPVVTMTRVATNEVVGGGVTLKGYTNTAYDLTVAWKDNISLSKSSVNGVIQLNNAPKTLRIYEQQPTTLKQTFEALDSSNNLTTITVTIEIVHPKLETIKTTNTNGSWGTVTAQLTPDVDDGVVAFEQKNGSGWTRLVGMPGSVGGYPVQPYKTIFTGGMYQFPNTWSLQNANGSSVGSVSQGGKITTQDLQLLVSFPQGYPVISMMNASGVVQYELVYAPQSLTGSTPIDIKTPTQYRLLSLTNFSSGIAGSFAGGQCIAPQLGECEVYVSTKGDIWVDQSVRSNYYGTYLYRNGHSVYQIMRNKVFVAEINLVTKDISQ